MAPEGDKIPNEFFSYDSGKPFDSCIQCGIDLLESGVVYVVEKSVKRYPEMDHFDIIYEYAMCMNCMEEQKESLSPESLANIEEYLKGNLSPENVLSSFSPDGEKNGKCAIYGTSLSEMTEYVYQGAFVADRISPGFHPLIFGEKAIAEMSELISDKTRDELDNFIDNHFSGPPEWREIIRRNKKVLI